MMISREDEIMATVPVKRPAAKAPAESVEERFRRLEAIWTRETGFLSNPDEIIGHAAFQEIIGIGFAVVPLMLHDLKERPGLWVWALPHITGADPVAKAERGNIAKMTAAWLRWGKEHGY
jgi:hypothetical protein